MQKHEACSLNNNGWCEIDHENFKIVNCVDKKIHIKIFESDFYKSKNNKFWPKVKKSDYNPVTEANYLECYDTFYFHNILRFPEFTPGQLKETLLFLCNVLEYCMENNYFLPTHLWNLTFYRCKPILIDIRDFQELGETCICQFPNWENLQDGYKICHNCKKKCKIHNITQIFNHVVSNNLESNVGKHISEFFTDYDDFLNILRNSKKLKNFNIKRIKKCISKCKVIKKNPDYFYSKFNNFYDKFEKILQNEYDTNNGKCPKRLLAKIINFSNIHYTKIIDLLNIMEIIKPKTVIDVGCNTGVISFLCTNFAEVVGIDSNPNLIDKANELGARFETNTQFLCTDILDKEKNMKLYGKKGCYGNKYDRFKSEMLLALGILEYMIKGLIYSKGVSLSVAVKHIIDVFSKYSNKYIIIENTKVKEYNKMILKQLSIYGFKQKNKVNNLLIFIKG